jgi:TorA maturation chaperone TorD
MRRLNLTISLPEDLAALLEAFADVYFGAQPSRVAEKTLTQALRTWLPMWLEELEKRDPAQAVEVAARAEQLQAAPAPENVTDLAMWRGTKMPRRRPPKDSA